MVRQTKFMMKQSFFILLFSVLSLQAFCQELEREIIANFIITEGADDGEIVTPMLLDAGAHIILYKKNGSDLVYMANVWENANSQSYGRIDEIETERIEETQVNHLMDFYSFNWNYVNTYDSRSGTAKVQMKLVYRPEKIDFLMKVTPEGQGALDYFGYMDESFEPSISD